MSIFTTTLILLTSLLTAQAAPAAGHDHIGHSHVSYSRRSDEVIKKWHQDPESETARMFRRGVPGDGVVGSQAWLQSYPTPSVTPTNIPQPWLDRLYVLRNSTVFPKYGPSAPNNGYPQYTNPNGGGNLSPTDSSVCSYTYECVEPSDVYNLTDGTIGLNFDDGPAPSSGRLYDFIEQNNISATHFMIGSNIYYNSQMFLRAVDDGGHLAVHTWSHPYMTTLTDEQVLGELGWTVQIIADNNGGRVPAYWRPPFGDVDNRVRLIALEVFGLKTVPWQINRDSGDYNIGHNPQYTFQSVTGNMQQWINGSKENGLLMLEHEISDADVDVFMAMYPQMIAAGWKVQNVAEAFDEWEYTNAESHDDPIVGGTSILQTASPGDLMTYEFALSHGDATGAGSTTQASSTSAMSSAQTSGTASSGAGTSARASSTLSTGVGAAASTGAARESVGRIGTGVWGGLLATFVGVGMGALAL